MSTYEQRQQQASEPSDEFVKSITKGDRKHLAERTEAAIRDHQSLHSVVHWLVHYGELRSTHPAETERYDAEAEVLAAKLDNDPKQIEMIIERYEERVVLGGQYG